MTDNKETYWKTFIGIPRHKIDWYFKYYLYKVFGITFDKLQDQREYWNTRGKEYFAEMSGANILGYEIFFQDLFVKQLKQLAFDSFFEAGCGFGWNVKRVKQEFPEVRVGGVDFSLPQLMNSRKYIPEIHMDCLQSDVCMMPLKDKAFDVGFSLGVFMNIHPDKIGSAIDEMCRVCGKYAIHLEWDQENTTSELREKRVFKTNIVSHDYRRLYEDRGKKVVVFQTYRDFGDDFRKSFERVSESVLWRKHEGAEKYIFIAVEM